MDFRLLGPLEVHDGGNALRLGPPKQRALLALLLLRPDRALARATAIDAVWGEEPPERAAEALQVYIHGLRKILGHDRIALRGSGYSLHVGRHELDLQRFERSLAQGQAAVASGDPAAAVEHFKEALGQWRGEPFADVELGSPGEAERARLDELRLRTLELDGEAKLALAQHEDLVPQLEALVVEHPFRETFRRQLMLALYRSGRQTDALDAFRETRKLLDDQLGLEPSPALAELERAILRHDASLDPPRRQPKLRLPAPATSFVGRNLDVAAVCGQLRDETRLLTLTGPGGIGKTRLAIEAAAELGAELQDGAIFVDLAPTVEPVDVAATIASTVVVSEADATSPLDAVTARLKPLEAVLVLDNFERLLDATPVVAHLVEQAPRIKVLVTSRAPLHLTAEREYNVQALDVLDDAIAIFVARAQAVDPGFRLTGNNADAVAQICRAVEGVPLALELAGARIRVLTPEQLLARLGEPLTVLSGGVRDAPPRQQTLRATIDWSYELLEPAAQQLFAQLAVFAGGCTLEAAESVCDAKLESLTALLDSSLLRRVQPRAGAPRFRMLDTVREYALELDGTDVRASHAQYFVSLSERLGAELIGPHRVTALSELAAEHENLRATLAYALVHDVDLGFRIAANLRSYWTTATRSREIRAWLQRAFERTEPHDTPARVGAELVFGRQLMTHGEYAGARDTLERVVAAARSLECWSEASAALGYLAWLSAAERDDSSCRSFAEQAIELSRRANDRWAERQGLAMVAASMINRGDYAQAHTYLDRSLALARELEDPSTVVLALANSGYEAIAEGDLARARLHLDEALELSRGLDEPPSTVSVLHLLAWEASLAGDPARTRAFLVDALELLREGGRSSHVVDVLTETALELEASNPEAAVRILAAADAGSPARGVPATRRYDAVRARLMPVRAGDVALTPEEAIVEALSALEG